jgi:PAS domain-containing protein
MKPKRDDDPASTTDNTVSRGFAGGRVTDETCKLLVEAMPNAIVLADAQGRIVLANAGAEKLFGYPREELLGQPVEMLVPARFRAGQDIPPTHGKPQVLRQVWANLRPSSRATATNRRPKSARRAGKARRSISHCRTFLKKYHESNTH